MQQAHRAHAVHDDRVAQANLGDAYPVDHARAGLQQRRFRIADNVRQWNNIALHHKPRRDQHVGCVRTVTVNAKGCVFRAII